VGELLNKGLAIDTSANTTDIHAVLSGME